MNLGEKIKVLRRNQNMSQEDLADKLQINRNSLSRIENDKTEATASVIKGVSSLFGVSISSLLDIEESNEVYEDKIKYVTENCKMLLETDLDFLVRVITIMKEEYVKKGKN